MIVSFASFPSHEYYSTIIILLLHFKTISNSIKLDYDIIKLLYYIIIKYYGDDVSIRKSPGNFPPAFRLIVRITLSFGAVAVHQAICDPGIRLSASIAFDHGRDNYCDNRLIITMTSRATIARCWCFFVCLIFNVLAHSRVAAQLIKYTIAIREWKVVLCAFSKGHFEKSPFIIIINALSFSDFRCLQLFYNTLLFVEIPTLWQYEKVLCSSIISPSYKITILPKFNNSFYVSAHTIIVIRFYDLRKSNLSCYIEIER